MRFSRYCFTLLFGSAVTLTAGAQTYSARPVLSAQPAPAQTRAPATGASTPGTSTSSAPVSSSNAPTSGTAAQPISGEAGTLPVQATGQALSANGGSTPADVPANYIIGPDDTLMISVWKEPSLSGNLPVRPDGMISLSLLGDIQATGYTPTQLGGEIANRLKKFVNDPNVTVTVMGVNSKRIFLIGEVGHVGPLPLTAGLTPLQAIATAGGVSAFANAKHIYILRTVAGKQAKIPFNYKKAVKDGDQQGVVLQSGDTIVVP